MVHEDFNYWEVLMSSLFFLSRLLNTSRKWLLPESVS